MSQDNVDNLRRGFEAYARGDLDEALANLDSDVVYKPIQEAAVRGRDAVRASLERWDAEWDEMEMTLEEIIDAGDHLVQAVLFRGRGRGSGVEVEGRFFQVHTVKEGKTVRWEEFSDRAEALEAVGLSEQVPSYDNVAIVHRARDAFNRRDFDALAEMSHEDLEFESVLAAVDAESTYRGPETWPNYFARMDEAWEDWQVEDFRPIDAGDDRVVATYRLTGTGKGSGVPVQQTAGMVYWLRDGKIWRLKSYLDQTEALEAVGLSEQDAHTDSS